MAKKRKHLAQKRKARHPSYSYMTKEHIFLDEHDEEKVLLFATGIMFGVGIASAFINLGFATFVFLVVGLILLFIEQRQL